MKKYLLLLCLLLGAVTLSAQGLDSVFVERYYQANRTDIQQAGNESLVRGAITYRIFVDMKPGYSLHSVFGSDGHPFILRSSTGFFNETNRGSSLANLIADRDLGNNAVMLDSWISLGAGSNLKFAVPKQDDKDGTVIKGHPDKQMLQNTNSNCGLSLVERDGLFASEKTPPRITQIGIDSLLSALSGKSDFKMGFEFKTDNGAYGCIGGAYGADSTLNRVCIGQFTTDGVFEFEINIQIGTKGKAAEQYVARNPSSEQQMSKQLIFSSKSIR